MAGGAQTLTVGTSAVKVEMASSTWTIQNLGSGTIYISKDPAVAAGGPGLQVESGEAFSSLVRGGDIWVVSDEAGTDVRVEIF